MTVLCMYNEFLFIEKMQCGYKELLLLRTFSCGFVISRVNCICKHLHVCTVYTYVRTYVCAYIHTSVYIRFYQYSYMYISKCKVTKPISSQPLDYVKFLSFVL